MKLVKYTIISALACASAHAATVSVGAGFGAASGLVVRTAAGAAIGGPSFFAVGSFETVPTITDIASFQAAVQSMNIFASSTTQATEPNKVAQSFTSIASPAAFNNNRIWFLLGNGLTGDTSTEFAIFTTALGTLFPADITQPGGPNITLSSVANIQVLNGAGSAISVDSNPDIIQLQVIPEPSTALLGLIGALGLLRRRR
jgi:hypothetical protein